MRDFLWWFRFYVFYNIRHPRVFPLKILRRITQKIKPPAEQVFLENNSTPRPIPKKIWMYWAQGWDAAPTLVRMCRDSWVTRNPGWEVIQLDYQNFKKYCNLPDSLGDKDIPHAAFSDILRIRLLAEMGGVWTDATTFCSAPLDSWIHSIMQSGFFAFQKPKTTLASWFLAAEQGNTLVKKWDEYVMQYWRYARKPGRYFWLHYLFEYLIICNPAARTIWQQTPLLSSVGPYAARDCLKTTGGGRHCSMS